MQWRFIQILSFGDWNEDTIRRVSVFVKQWEFWKISFSWQTMVTLTTLINNSVRTSRWNELTLHFVKCFWNERTLVQGKFVLKRFLDLILHKHNENCHFNENSVATRPVYCWCAIHRRSDDKYDRMHLWGRCIYEWGAHLMTGEVMLAVYKCSSADFTRVPTMHALTPHHLWMHF